MLLLLVSMLIAIGLLGVLNLLSAIWPSEPAMMRELARWLPLEVTQRSRAVMLLAGLALLQVTRNLGRRKSLAWGVAVAALSVSLVSHTLRAFDVHHSLVAALLLAYLLAFRSRFTARSDPASLRPVIDDLRARVPDLAHDDADLATITRRIIAGDGTYLTTLAEVAWALRHTKSDGKKQGQVRANVQLDVANWVPQVVSVSGDDGQSDGHHGDCPLVLAGPGAGAPKRERELVFLQVVTLRCAHRDETKEIKEIREFINREIGEIREL